MYPTISCKMLQFIFELVSFFGGFWRVMTFSITVVRDSKFRHEFHVLNITELI